MGVAFFRGQQLGRQDLHIYLANASDVPVNAAEITYALADVTTGLEATVGNPYRVPANPSIGEYYASIVIPLDANLGLYRVRWTFREVVGGPIQQVVQEFEVIDKLVTLPTSIYTPAEAKLIHSLRVLLRDNNPDRNYHFRPPAHEETIRQFNRVFGFIWEDDELKEYLDRALDMISLYPPFTAFPNLDFVYNNAPAWRTVVLTGAMIYALQALQINWIADEFDYSIGGVSLSIEKSSKYESARAAAKEQFDTQIEKAKATVNIIRGLQQPRYGTGIRSAFGPYVGAGVLTPRKFMGVLPSSPVYPDGNDDENGGPARRHRRPGGKRPG